MEEHSDCIFDVFGNPGSADGLGGAQHALQPVCIPLGGGGCRTAEFRLGEAVHGAFSAGIAERCRLLSAAGPGHGRDSPRRIRRHLGCSLQSRRRRKEAGNPEGSASRCLCRDSALHVFYGITCTLVRSAGGERVLPSGNLWFVALPLWDCTGELSSPTRRTCRRSGTENP